MVDASDSNPDALERASEFESRPAHLFPFKEIDLVEVVSDPDPIWIGKQGVITQVIPLTQLKNGKTSGIHSHPFLVRFPDNTTRWFKAGELKPLGILI